jgi:hypothetical protein
MVGALLVPAGALAQRARTVSDPPAPADAKTTPAPAPASVKAKYEGGIFGYMKKQTGTLNFDDANDRLVFRDKQGKEYVHVPYDSISVVYPNTKAQTTTTGRVISSVPTPYGVGLLGLLMRDKTRYMVLHFNDPDTKANGVTSFKLESKELLASVIHTLAEKAELTPRGEAYVRKSKITASTP